MKKFYICCLIVWLGLLVVLILIGSKPQYQKQSGAIFGLLFFSFPLLLISAGNILNTFFNKILFHK